jgi:hypothetical protein
MTGGRRKSGPKSEKTSPHYPVSAVSLSLSIRRSSHQPKPPSASTSLASPHLAIPTTSQPPPHLKQPPFLPLSHFCRSLPLLPVNDSGHRSSQKRCQNHQLILLITAETPALSKPLLRQPPVSATISVACRTWTTVHVLQIISIVLGPKKKKIFWAEIGPLCSGFMPGSVIWADPTHMF